MKPPIKVETRFVCKRMSPKCKYYKEGPLFDGIVLCDFVAVEMEYCGAFTLVCENRKAQADALYPAGRSDD